jgi:hypothetical protein
MNLYTEKRTRLLYDAKMYDDFILVRPITPGWETFVQQLDHLAFADLFEEFSGCYDPIIEFLGTQSDDLLLEEEGHE